MSDEEAREAFQRIRWADTNGEPVCPRCRCGAVYAYRTRPLWKCKACQHQFSVTSGTIFASRKLPVRDYLLTIAIFVNGAKGHAELQLSRDLDCQYKTAFVMAHKIREAMAADGSLEKLSGSVEIDGAYFGGYVKPANRLENRRDRRLFRNQSHKRRVVVVMRERSGQTLPFVFRSEEQSIPAIKQHVADGSVIYADEAPSWEGLHAKYLTRRVNHSIAYSDGNGTSTNMAESFFSRLRRAEVGIHHRIAGPYLSAYATEMAWREDRRRVSNGEQFLLTARSALEHPVSRQWKGYWQRAKASQSLGGTPSSPFAAYGPSFYGDAGHSADSHSLRFWSAHREPGDRVSHLWTRQSYDLVLTARR
jgi:transposase-like protein